MPKKQKPTILFFDKEYLLLHEILNTLCSVGLNITASGSEAQGYDPFYEFQVRTARLHFGTLVLLLNEPDKLKPSATGEINYWQNMITKRENVTISKYDWKEVAGAVDSLMASGDVKKEIHGQFLEPGAKIIVLTDEGFASFNSKKYLTKYQKERNAQILFNSTIRTNGAMRRFTGILAFAALGTIILQSISLIKPTNSIPPPTIIIQKCS